MLRDYSSAGEHFVDIEGVTGSIPVGFYHNIKGLALNVNHIFRCCHSTVTIGETYGNNT